MHQLWVLHVELVDEVRHFQLLLTLVHLFGNLGETVMVEDWWFGGLHNGHSFGLRLLGLTLRIRLYLCLGLTFSLYFVECLQLVYVVGRLDIAVVGPIDNQFIHHLCVFFVLFLDEVVQLFICDGEHDPIPLDWDLIHGLAP